MRILITGGTGFLGRRLSGRLAQDGHDVIVLTRDALGAQEGLPPGVQAARWDAQSSAGWAYLADGAGAIINLAGENIAAGRWTGERKKRILASRLQAGTAVIEAIDKARRKPAVLIQASAVGYYGNRGDDLLNESEPAGNGFEARVCVEWEASTQPVEAMGLRRPIVRTGVALDRGGGALPRMATPFMFFAGGPVGSGHQGLSWIHRDDWVEAVRFLLLDERAHGPVNLTAPTPVTMDEFGRALAHCLGRPYWASVPPAALRLMFGEMADVLLEGRKAIPARLQEWGFKFQFPTIEQALAAIYG